MWDHFHQWNQQRHEQRTLCVEIEITLMWKTEWNRASRRGILKSICYFRLYRTRTSNSTSDKWAFSLVLFTQFPFFLFLSFTVAAFTAPLTPVFIPLKRLPQPYHALASESVCTLMKIVLRSWVSYNFPSIFPSSNVLKTCKLL